MSKEEFGLPQRTIMLSHGLVWRMLVMDQPDSKARIEQVTMAGVPAEQGISILRTEIRLIAHWLRGSYSACEWPTRWTLTDGSLLHMLPIPNPELWLEQLPMRSRNFQKRTGDEGDQETREAAKGPTGRLMLYEEDLRPVVTWLMECAAEHA